MPSCLILIVEDDAALRGTLAEQITTEGDFTTDEAESLAEASAKLADGDVRYDAILLDIGLPDGDSRDFCAKLRRDGKRMPVIMLTGKYGEMSTLGNYLFQNFNFRSKSKLSAFYSLVACITAEELGHVELVSNGIAMPNNGPDPKTVDTKDGDDISGAPMEAMKDIRSFASFASGAGGALPVNSNSMWRQDQRPRWPAQCLHAGLCAGGDV